jgi:transketolase
MMQDSMDFIGLSSRDAYGKALLELGAADDRIVTVTADVPVSTRLAEFQSRWPERFFNFGIAEQNMVGAAAGLARSGKIPFVSVYAIFVALRATEQVRTDVAYPNLPVRFCVSHSGISLGQAGPTHHSIEDIAIMRSMANMTVIVPADGLSAARAVQAAMDLQGPAYIRLSRAVEPTVYRELDSFEIGRARSVRQGADLTIVACGASVGHALQAATILETEGIQAGVVDMATVKPIDREAVLSAIETTGGILTVEEHNVIGGLGSAVAEVIAESGKPVRFGRLGIPDTYTLAASYPDLQHYYSLDGEGIAGRARALLA